MTLATSTAKASTDFENHVLYVDGESGIFSELCDRPWFDRKWTVQEYVLARDACFQCGGQILQAHKLFTALEDILRHRFERRITSENQFLSRSYLAYHDIFDSVRQAFQLNESINNFSLLEIMERGRYLSATEPKDAVFALYGILQRIEVNIIPPDYSKSVEQVYAEVTKTVILFDKSLRMLVGTGEDSSRSNLPSWGPNCRFLY
jgi:hypothetical protein